MAFGGRVITAVITWLSHRSFWQLASLGLAIILIIQHFQLLDARHDRDAYLKQRDGYAKQLRDISSKRNEQKAETAERIKVVTREIRHADDRAKVIESAPLPGNCKTPDAVLQADI